jgi:hypothetical protein
MFKSSIRILPFADDDHDASISTPNAIRMAQIVTSTVPIKDTKT